MQKYLLFILLILTFPIWIIPLLVGIIVDMMFFDGEIGAKLTDWTSKL